MTTAAKVEAALEAAGLRGCVQGIEDNVATSGEVVIWSGMGHPVYSVRQAVDLVRRMRDEEESKW